MHGGYLTGWLRAGRAVRSCPGLVAATVTFSGNALRPRIDDLVLVFQDDGDFARRARRPGWSARRGARRRCLRAESSTVARLPIVERQSAGLVNTTALNIAPLFVSACSTSCSAVLNSVFSVVTITIAARSDSRFSRPLPVSTMAVEQRGPGVETAKISPAASRSFS